MMVLGIQSFNLEAWDGSWVTGLLTDHVYVPLDSAISSSGSSNHRKKIAWAPRYPQSMIFIRNWYIFQMPLLTLYMLHLLKWKLLDFFFFLANKMWKLKQAHPLSCSHVPLVSIIGEMVFNLFMNQSPWSCFILLYIIMSLDQIILT